MHHKQKIPTPVHADDGILHFITTASIYYLKEWIEECLCRLLERHTIMFSGVNTRFLLIPNEGYTIQDEVHIHELQE